MKKHFKLFLTMISVGLSSICLFTKCFAGDHPVEDPSVEAHKTQLTAQKKESYFKLWFETMAKDFQYDKDFAKQSEIAFVGRNMPFIREKYHPEHSWEDFFKTKRSYETESPFDDPYIEEMCTIVWKYGKGTSINFACYVKKELDKLGIENKLMFIRDESSGTGLVCNIYTSPVTGEIKIADLTNTLCDANARILSDIPKDQYLSMYNLSEDDILLTNNGVIYNLEVIRSFFHLT